MTSEQFRIRNYETGPDGAVPLHTLCDYFQEAAGLDALKLAFGAGDLVSGATWVLARMQLAPLAKVTAGSMLTVHTWHSFSDKLFSRREFYITNEKNETVLKGSSWWVLIDIKTRRIVRVAQKLLDLNPATPEFVLDEHNPKAPDFTGAEPLATLPILVRDEDIDTNAHVNNTHFTAWAIESAPREIATTRTLKQLVITFKGECHAKDRLTMFVHTSPPVSAGAQTGVAHWHLLVRENDGTECARVHTRWE